MEYVENCFTCEFGFDNDGYDEEYNPFHPDKFIITCAGSNDYYGKEVEPNFCCNCWGESLSEFIRVNKKIDYEVYYKDRLKLAKE